MDKYIMFAHLAKFQAKLVINPHAPKYYSLVQNNFGGNFGLNFVACEQGLTSKKANKIFFERERDLSA